MRVKTYRGPETKAVLARIKAELGPDAVILSTRSCAENGKTLYEVTAALEDAAEVRPEATAEDAGLTRESVPGYGQWHKEWSQIRDHLTALLRPQLELDRLTPFQRHSLEFLEREGVCVEVIAGLFRELLSMPKASILTPLERLVGVRSWGMQHWQQRVHVLAGPHGAGKTSALIRMALQLKHESPGLRICVVNAGQHRLGSRMALKQYAELSDLAYREACDGMTCAAVLAKSHEFDRVLVDLPGLDRGTTLHEQLERLGMDANDDVCVHLVLSPGYAPAQLRAFEAQYASPRTASLIWTKLDEACGFSAVVNTAASSGLPVSAMSYGSGFSDTLTPGSHLLLWRLVFKHRLPNEQ